jgi:hypothetical protein
VGVRLSESPDSGRAHVSSKELEIMKDKAIEATVRRISESAEGATVIGEIVAEGVQPGQVPLKVVTGRQTTTSLSFDLQPGAIVAHRGASVIFVCG